MVASAVELGLAAVPGVIALLGGAVGYGRLLERLRAVERDVADVNDIKTKVAAIDARTTSTENNINSIKGSVDKIYEYLLGEARTFAQPPDRTRRGR